METKPTPFWNKEKIIKACSSKLAIDGPDIYFSNIVIDSRKVIKDSLFIAIKGENMDGHDFVLKALESGATGVLIDEKNRDLASLLKDINCFIVKDTIKALGDLAHYKKSRFNIKTIGVTGSVGKTSTREILKSILSVNNKVLTPEKNFNNHIGVPLTLLNAEDYHNFAIIEMGMSNKNEISYLSKLAEPDISIITKIAPAHIESFKDVREIAKEKSDITKGMKKGSFVIINEEDSILNEFLKDFKVLRFGESNACDIKIFNKEIKNSKPSADFLINFNNRNKTINADLNVFGEIVLKNSAAALTAALLLGITEQEIKTGLKNYPGVKGRFFLIHDKKRDISFIDDSYNSNPESLKASINDFSKIAEKNRKILVIGDMLELGDKSDTYHFEAGKQAAGISPCAIFAYGSFSDFIVKGAAEVSKKETFIFQGSHKEIADELLKVIKPKDWILIKGSRGSKMEEILTMLTNKPE